PRESGEPSGSLPVLDHHEVIDDLEHAAQLRRVLHRALAADLAEPQRAQGVALLRAGAVSGAHLLELELSHSALPPLLPGLLRAGLLRAFGVGLATGRAGALRRD